MLCGWTWTFCSRFESNSSTLQSATSCYWGVFSLDASFVHYICCMAIVTGLTISTTCCMSWGKWKAETSRNSIFAFLSFFYIRFFDFVIALWNCSSFVQRFLSFFIKCFMFIVGNFWFFSRCIAALKRPWHPAQLSSISHDRGLRAIDLQFCLPMFR